MSRVLSALALPLVMGLSAAACQQPAVVDLPPADRSDVGPAAPGPDAGSGGQAPTESPFDPSRVIEVRLELTPAVWADIIANARDETYHSGNIVYDGVRLDDVAIRVKGNSSLNAVAGTASHRFSFKVDTNRYVEGQALLGEKKLNFNNGFKDPSFMREHLAYGLFEAIGVPRSRTSFVDLYVAGEHLGLYTMVEQVDGNYLDEHFADGGGDLYKPENPAGSLQYRGTSITNYQGAELKRNEDTSDHRAFLAFVQALQSGTREELDAVFDVDTFLKYLAVNTVIVNLDSYVGTGHNYYIYEQGGRFTVIPWDLNEAFGNFKCRCDRAQIIDFKIDEPTCGAVSERPLVSRVLAEADYKATYHRYLRAFLDEHFTEAKVGAKINATAELIRSYVRADTTKFFTDADFETNLQSDTTGRGGGAIGLMTFVRERRAALIAQLDGASSPVAMGQGTCGGGGGPGGPGGPGMMGQHPCGDGVCDQVEMGNPMLCPRDCEDRPDDYDWCGDGICDALERSERSCPEDCN